MHTTHHHNHHGRTNHDNDRTNHHHGGNDINNNPTFINDDDLGGDLYDSAGTHYVVVRRVDFDDLALALKFLSPTTDPYPHHVIDAARALVDNVDHSNLDDHPELVVDIIDDDTGNDDSKLRRLIDQYVITHARYVGHNDPTELGDARRALSSLPQTGGDTTTPLTAAAGLLLSGGGILIAARRRR